MMTFISEKVGSIPTLTLDIEILKKNSTQELINLLGSSPFADLADIYQKAKIAKGTGLLSFIRVGYSKIIKSIDSINKIKQYDIENVISFCKNISGIKNLVKNSESFKDYFAMKFPDKDPSGVNKEVVIGYLNNLKRRATINENEKPLTLNDEKLIAELASFKEKYEKAIKFLDEFLQKLPSVSEEHNPLIITGLLTNEAFLKFMFDNALNIKISSSNGFPQVIINGTLQTQNAIQRLYKEFLATLLARSDVNYVGTDKVTVQEIEVLTALPELLHLLSRIDNFNGNAGIEDNKNSPQPKNNEHISTISAESLNKLNEGSVDLSSLLFSLRCKNNFLFRGETIVPSKTVTCGDMECNFADVLRAYNLSNKEIEDRVEISNHAFQLANGTDVKTTLIISNDGASSSTSLTKYYCERAKVIFPAILQRMMGFSGEESISDELIKLALAKTHHLITNVEWPDADSTGSLSVNMVFLMPAKAGYLRGFVFKFGDNHILLLKKDVSVERLGSAVEGVQTCSFTVNQGESLFISSAIFGLLQLPIAA